MLHNTIQVPALVSVVLFLLSAYVAFVASVVTGRMSRETPHTVRFSVAAAGGVAVWAMGKCIGQSWAYTPNDIALGLLVSIIAAVLLSQPRIRV